MICQHYFPSSHLRPFVAWYWTLELSSDDEAGQHYRLIPDGYVDWVFHLKQLES